MLRSGAGTSFSLLLVVHPPASLQEYKKQGRQLPQKTGPTSILAIVNERLKAAGLRPAKKTPSAGAAATAALPAAEEAPQPWQPVAHVPYAHLVQHTKGSTRGTGAAPHQLGARRKTRALLSGRRTPQVRPSSPCPEAQEFLLH
jgi:hypothetical protein